MKILFLGAPGSGKSTQGQKIAEARGIKWLSTGQMLRDSDEPWIKEKLATGELFDDEFITGMALREIVKYEDIILDGFPRTLVQAQKLVQAGVKIDKIVEIDVSAEEILQRMLLRGRDEDNEEVIGKRISIYEATRDEIVGFLTENGSKFVKIDGVGTPEEVNQRVEGIFLD